MVLDQPSTIKVGSQPLLPTGPTGPTKDFNLLSLKVYRHVCSIYLYHHCIRRRSKMDNLSPKKGYYKILYKYIEGKENKQRGYEW